jgi:outer membrane protein TolC
MVSVVLTAAVSLSAAQRVEDTKESFFTDNPQLEEYIRVTLVENPGLHEAFARYRASLQKVPQVKSLPDPVLSFTQYARSPETRVGPQSNVTKISQMFPWFGKLDLKGQMAVKEARAVYELYKAHEREVAAKVKAAFYELAYVDRAVRVLMEEESLLGHYETLAQARYSQGSGLQQAVIKIQAELTRILDRLSLLDQQRESLTARLNTLMDRPPEQAIPVVGEINLPDVTLDLDQLYALGEDHRQELKAVLERIEKSERSIELAKKDYWPDFSLSAGLVNVENREDPAGVLAPPPDNGKNAFSLSIGINVPIWRDKYRAGVVEATEEKIAVRRSYSRIRNDIEFSIRDQVVRLQTLKDQLDLYDRVLLTQAEEALHSSESAYETGQLSVLELLDSERFLLQTRLIRERYRADYMKALSELERAVGTRFPII